MIGNISGKVLVKDAGTITVSVGGFGFVVRVTADTIKSVREGEEVNLVTHLAVREDALDLYGFLTKEELSFFKLLIGVSGIGPKSALGILSVAPPKILEKAVVTGNTSYLTKVSGIGQKNAEKIILGLKDKIGGVEGESGLEDDEDVVLALRSLGYGGKEIREALKKITEDVSGAEERIKEALKQLGRS